MTLVAAQILNQRALFGYDTRSVSQTVTARTKSTRGVCSSFKVVATGTET